MRTLLLFAVLVFCFSLSYAAKKDEPAAKSGYYILVEDYTDRSNHTYLLESKDSVDVIFDQFFKTELELGNINYPITIDNGKQSFFVARVELFESKNGKTHFKHLKYPKIYNKRKQTDPASF